MFLRNLLDGRHLHAGNGTAQRGHHAVDVGTTWLQRWHELMYLRTGPASPMPPIRHARILAMTVVLLLAGAAPAAAQSIRRPVSDPRVTRMVSAISETRLRTLVERLAAFGTRHTLSDTVSPTRGIGAARQFIYDELARSSPRL